MALGAVDLETEGAPKVIGAGALAYDGGAGELPLDGLSWISLWTVRLYSSSSQACVALLSWASVRSTPFEHGDQAPIDLLPERFCSVVLGGVRHLMSYDAQSISPCRGLARLHGGAVVDQQGPRLAALLQRLPQPVGQYFGALAEVPLQVASQSRAIVESAE